MNWAMLSFAFGVGWVQCQALLPSTAGLLAGGIGLWGLARMARPVRRWLWMGMAMALLGAAWASGRAELRLADTLPEAWIGRDVVVRGVVASLPSERNGVQRFEFAVDSVLTADATVPKRLLLSIYPERRANHPPARVWPGERWQWTVRLKPPHGAANPGGFDFEAWLLERGLRATGSVRPGDWIRLPPPAFQPAVWVERWRAEIRSRFSASLPEADYPWAGILIALAIGDQSAVDSRLWQVFNRTSTTHLMSVSGLHVTLVAGLLGWLVNRLWRRWPRACLALPAQKAGLAATAVMALGYAWLAGFGIPAQRTVIMLLVAVLGLWSGRAISPSRTWLIALTVVLLWDPWAVLAAGFWLSFAAVGALLWIGTGQTGQRLDWRWRIRSWGGVQWAATLATLPILALLFQQVSLVSPLANALAIPVISWLVTPLALLAVLLPWSPILSVAHAVLAPLMAFLIHCAEWPLWQVAAPPTPLVLAAMLGAGLLLLPRGVPGRWLGLVLLAPLLVWNGERPAEGDAWVTVLDVGQGLSVVVQTAHETLLFDPGPRYTEDADAGDRVVLPFLRWAGITCLERLVVSHADSDHAGGVASVLSGISVAQVLTPVPRDWGEPCLAGQAWVWSGVQFRMLHPTAEVVSGPRAGNAAACVLQVTAHGRAVLLTSDIEAAVETALVAREGAALASTVLLVPHHGSKTSSSPDFLAAVGARHAVVSAGFRNRFRHPAADVVARHTALGSRVWRTDQAGAIRIRLHAQGVEVVAQRRLSPRYWHGR